VNPELQRNLWQELSPGRLLVPPVMMVLVVALAVAVPALPGMNAVQARSAEYLLQWAAILLVVVYGSRQAGDAVFSEVAGRTWDAQRLSSVGAWRMAWGKLLGSTAFTWYAAAWAMAGGALCAVLQPPPIPVAWWVGDLKVLLAGIAAQAVALFASLVLLRSGAERSRRAVGTANVAGIAVGLGATQAMTTKLLTPLVWYGVEFGHGATMAVLIVLGAAWAIAGLYALLREELELTEWPWAWISFVGAAVVIVPGFVEGGSVGDRLEIVSLVASVLAWAALFGGVKDGVRLGRFAAAVKGARVKEAIDRCPAWLIAWFVAIVTAMIGMLLGIDGGSEAATGPLSLAAALFMLRDAALVLALTARPGRHRGLQMTAVLLAVLYGVLPWLLGVPAGPIMRAVFLPIAPVPVWTVVFPAVEAGAAWIVFAWLARSWSRPG
jgi:hypothetical protein